MPFYLWPMTSPLPVLAGCRLVMSGPCACFTSVYVQNLSAAHAFAATWGLFCTFCRLSLTSYGMNYFLIPHSLWPAPFRAGLYLIVGFFSFSPFFYSFLQFAFPAALFCHSYCGVIWPKPAGPVVYPSPNDSAWLLVLFLHGLQAPVSHFLIGHPWLICFS